MNDEAKTFVEACEQRCAKATPGPIDVHRYDNEGGRISYQLQQSTGDAIVLCAFDDDDNLNARNDAAFYSHARADLPEALRIIREQNSEISAMRKEWLGNISDIAKELAAFGFVDESGGDGIVLAVRNALTKQAEHLTRLQAAAQRVTDLRDECAVDPTSVVNESLRKLDMEICLMSAELP
jgi:hypothetical protein